MACQEQAASQLGAGRAWFWMEKFLLAASGMLLDLQLQNRVVGVPVVARMCVLQRSRSSLHLSVDRCHYPARAGHLITSDKGWQVFRNCLLIPVCQSSQKPLFFWSFEAA